jgi:hypothetical protein
MDFLVFINARLWQFLSNDVVTWLQAQGFTSVVQNFPNTTNWFFGDIIFVRK